jgi:tRNA-specific 2-thiouridylase
VRFDTLSEWADRMGFDYVATGHYARTFRSQEGHTYLARSSNASKDQSYFLSALPCGVLPRVLFPLGDREKAEVRASARRAGLSVAEKPDSQEVCFVSTRTLREFLDGKVPLAPGNVETVDGGVVGRHDGLATYTIGQRRGLGVAAGRPQYVVALDVARNAVVLATTSSGSRELTCRLADRRARRRRSRRAPGRRRRSAATGRGLSCRSSARRYRALVFESPSAPSRRTDHRVHDGDVVLGPA